MSSSEVGPLVAPSPSGFAAPDPLDPEFEDPEFDPELTGVLSGVFTGAASLVLVASGVNTGVLTLVDVFLADDETGAIKAAVAAKAGSEEVVAFEEDVDALDTEVDEDGVLEANVEFTTLATDIDAVGNAVSVGKGTTELHIAG